MTFPVVDGGNGSFPEPDWSLIFSDELDIEAAREHWRAITIELRENDKLAPVNAHQIKRLVISYVMFDLATRRLIEESPVIKAKRTKLAQYNPWFTVWKDANAIASTHEAELTLNPRRRINGGKVQRKVKRVTAADAYLRPVAK